MESYLLPLALPNPHPDIRIYYLMKYCLAILALCAAISGYSQRYTAGLKKTGTVIDNIEGQFVVNDSSVSTTLEGKTDVYKIVRREGYTIHVKAGDMHGKFVITHHAGKLHGFTYDRQITYHPDKRHAGAVQSMYYAKIER